MQTTIAFPRCLCISAMNQVRLLTILVAVLYVTEAEAQQPNELQTMLKTAATKHLDLLLNKDGSVIDLKGKGGDGEESLAFYRLFELTGDQRYRKAAVELVDRVLKDMRATKFGVLAIKEKEKEGGKKFIGGGPPAMGFYIASAAYILHKQGGRNEDLRYIAKVFDSYPWNDKGWWSADIDVKTGESKVTIDKPSPVNKTAAMAMAGGILSVAMRDIDPVMSARLKQKTDKCVYDQVLPAQLDDGFWHYGLTGNDPKDKDILGYFMLTVHVLMELQQFHPEYREPKLDAAIRKAQTFALKCIAPITDPNNGPACEAHTTPSTPKHYTLRKEPKRGFELTLLLLGGGFIEEGTKIMNASLPHFDYGNGGMDGVHAVAPILAAIPWLNSSPSRK